MFKNSKFFVHDERSWIPACAGMTIEDRFFLKNLRHASEGWHPRQANARAFANAARSLSWMAAFAAMTKGDGICPAAPGKFLSNISNVIALPAAAVASSSAAAARAAAAAASARSAAARSSLARASASRGANAVVAANAPGVTQAAVLAALSAPVFAQTAEEPAPSPPPRWWRYHSRLCRPRPTPCSCRPCRRPARRPTPSTARRAPLAPRPCSPAAPRTARGPSPGRPRAAAQAPASPARHP